ncbi:MAG: response regulator transcription factor [Cyanobacteria bacterium K_Offshore_surface_m2_239]|nr:response regulator transcription factor [Cyanobacteria bacterium K_Offshore_surface_m2_239]
MADTAPLLWLIGAAAVELAPRLEASGYRTASAPLPQGPEEGASPPPAAVILSPSFADRIPDLRRSWGAVPILLGSPRDDVEGRCQALSGGADDLWLTSVGPSDLLTRLRLHLNLQPAPPPPGEAAIVVGDLRVDPQGQTVTRGGRVLALTSREQQLLLLLLRHRPGVVSRERILREIWPEERGAASNVIEVYVRYLRRKLEEGGHARLIHTVRGEGYCLRQAPASSS